MRFKLAKKFKPAGDQPRAIKKLLIGIREGKKNQTLLGVTGSGKTFSIANVIEKTQKPTLVIAHNKTLAAQLVQEFRTFFPDNAVGYFVSYYDYYQPEAYISSTDTYIEKETQINEEIDRLRHQATSAILSRQDVIIVASVSCIYGLGRPEDYKKTVLSLEIGKNFDRQNIISALSEIHYKRSDLLQRGFFRAIGDRIEVVPAGSETAIRIELQKNIITSIQETDLLNGKILRKNNTCLIFPAKHFLVPEESLKKILSSIEQEATKREKYFLERKKIAEAERISRRTRQDLELIREIGYCNGIENYSRYLSQRQAGEAPCTLLDYFPEDFLTVIDESHVTIPQVGGMYAGDYSRKKNLVDNGFRLPSAFDNRPLRFEEFEKKIKQVIFVSATPGAYEKKHSTFFVEQLIRPTGLIDPSIEIRSAAGQVADIVKEIETILEKNKNTDNTSNDRILVTTLTKKQAENLSDFLKEHKIKAEYLHSNVETLDRIKILEELRCGKFDVLVGVNLLREGLDLPEVSLVAILDADKEGFLRNETSLIQTMGRAARNVNGRVILYADRLTGSIEKAVKETTRRRKIQLEYNKKNHITPRSIQKSIASIVDHEIKSEIPQDFIRLESMEDIAGYIKLKEKEMKEASRALEFEKAALIRDEIWKLRKMQKEQ